MLTAGNRGWVGEPGPLLAEPFHGFLAEPFHRLMLAEALVGGPRARITAGARVVWCGADAAGSGAVNPAPWYGGRPGAGG
ncbi:hypothetical protein GCM10022226_77900 [Sphaerisporangium flaviroseum]|uniref:Uncharacterized protein n=1 Tax=Sphaerisporangium flaviroseum TaxID=509199 RepID=A0ABP7JF29_9ACTN